LAIEARVEVFSIAYQSGEKAGQGRAPIRRPGLFAAHRKMLYFPPK
jgi:hypothetical protein